MSWVVRTSRRNELNCLGRMRPGSVQLYICLLLGGLIVGSSDLASQNSPGKTQCDLLRRHIKLFNVLQTTRIDALMKLGQENRLSLGIEYANPDHLRAPITVRLEDGDIEEALAAILGPLGGYSWRCENGVINIRHKGSPTARNNILDRLLTEFSIPESTQPVTIILASAYLRIGLQRHLYPTDPCRGARPCGTVGSLPVGRLDNRVRPFTSRRVTVRQVLNRLVSEHNNAAWIVLVPPRELARKPPETLSLNVNDLWQIYEYDLAATRWSDIILLSLRPNWPSP